MQISFVSFRNFRFKLNTFTFIHRNMPEIFIIAGCNGAGKTTAAYNLLPSVFETSEFINADEIARGINPNNVEAAAFSVGKIMLQRINELI